MEDDKLVDGATSSSDEAVEKGPTVEELQAKLEKEQEARRQLTARAKAAEEEAKRLKESELSAPSQDFYSDEGKMLKGNIDALQKELADLKIERELSAVKSAFPQIEGKMEDFDLFRASYPGAKLENVAKLFLMENGALEAPARKGVEKPTGGPSSPAPAGMSMEDIARLRVNNYPLYLEKVLSGELKF